MKPTFTLLVVVTAICALAGCGKAQEKMIESAIEKDGGKAKVDLSGGGMKITTTDASGKSVQVEMGAAKVSEADVGVAFYRDKLKAQSAGKQFMDMSGNDGNATLMLSDDAAKSTLQVQVMKADKGTDIQIMAQRKPTQ